MKVLCRDGSVLMLDGRAVIAAVEESWGRVALGVMQPQPEDHLATAPLDEWQMIEPLTLSLPWLPAHRRQFLLRTGSWSERLIDEGLFADTGHRVSERRDIGLVCNLADDVDLVDPTERR